LSATVTTGYFPLSLSWCARSGLWPLHWPCFHSLRWPGSWLWIVDFGHPMCAPRGSKNVEMLLQSCSSIVLCFCTGEVLLLIISRLVQLDHDERTISCSDRWPLLPCHCGLMYSSTIRMVKSYRGFYSYGQDIGCSFAMVPMRRWS
jgi:hypothetical protein